MFECFHGMTHLLYFHNRCFNPAENVQRPEPYEVSDLMVKKRKCVNCFGLPIVHHVNWEF